MKISIGTLDNAPLGRIWIAVGKRGLTAVTLWDDQAEFEEEVSRLTGAEPMIDQNAIAPAAAQIEAYLRGEQRRFDLPLDWSVMTPFQKLALEEVCKVEYGRLSTYGTIAAALGKPKALRAVGRANATNPIPLVIPCHRILGSDGKLHGYNAPDGLETKAWLLRLEGSWLL